MKKILVLKVTLAIVVGLVGCLFGITGVAISVALVCFYALNKVNVDEVMENFMKSIGGGGTIPPKGKKSIGGGGTIKPKK